MALAWLTDIHLEFAGPAEGRALFDAIRKADAPLLVTGDISNATRLESDLRALRKAAGGKPVYFVLGNHDYYHGSIKRIRERIAGLCSRDPGFVWLSQIPMVELSATTALVGHDGWADVTLGDPSRAVMLNDEFLIEELTGANRQLLFTKLEALGRQAAEHLKAALLEAMRDHSRLLLATHIPPFAEACWHDGRISDPEWLPRFTCGAVGAMLRDVMELNASHHLEVYCGHSHGEGYARILPNLEVWTGGAEYGRPVLQKTIEF